METQIKFSEHYIQNANTGKKCRVRYSLDNRYDGKKCVTIYAKSYRGDMSGIIDCKNDTDTIILSTISSTDYFEPDRAVLFENHPQYQIAKKIAEEIIMKRAELLKRYEDHSSTRKEQ